MQLFCVLLFVVLVWGVIIAFFSNRRIASNLKDAPIGKELIFNGKYVNHWEVSRFVWQIGNARVDTWDSAYNCRLEFLTPELATEFRSNIGDSSLNKGNHFSMKFKGKILEVGRFGHKGMCRYRVQVLELISMGTRMK